MSTASALYIFESEPQEQKPLQEGEREEGEVPLSESSEGLLIPLGGPSEALQLPGRDSVPLDLGPPHAPPLVSDSSLTASLAAEKGLHQAAAEAPDPLAGGVDHLALGAQGEGGRGGGGGGGGGGGPSIITVEAQAVLFETEDKAKLGDVILQGPAGQQQEVNPLECISALRVAIFSGCSPWRGGPAYQSAGGRR